MADAYHTGELDAEQDFNNVGTDFAVELTDQARTLIEKGASPRVAIKKLISDFRERNGKDWLQEAMKRAFDSSEDDLSGEEVRRYAIGYVTHYLKLIEEHVIATIKDDLRRQKEVKMTREGKWLVANYRGMKGYGKTEAEARKKLEYRGSMDIEQYMKEYKENS